MSKSVKFVKIISPIALAIALSACGGGSGANFGSNTGNTGNGNNGNTNTGTGTATQNASSLELSVSSRQLPSDGSAPITITAIAKDANNNAIDGADIVFSVDKDATIIKNATVTTTTDPNNPTATPITTVVTAGSIQTATLTPGSKTNQTLNVTVISGSSSKSITVDVVGTTVSVEGPTGITLGQDSPYVLKLKDSSNNPIAFQQVVVSSANGNQITTDSNFETDATGEIAFNLNSTTSGTDTISASVLGTSYTKLINVSGDEFKLSNSNEEININTATPITFKWTKDGVAQVGKNIVLSATRGNINNQSTVTNSAGEAPFTISSTTAGKTVITATSADGLSTSINREFVATTPAYLNTQASPTLIAPNTSSTIIAKIRDLSDNPVKNKIIDFRLEDTVDGTLSASTATTDSLGRASVSYTAGNSSSATNGVKISTFIQGYPAVSADDVSLTVGGNALRLVLGEDQLIAVDEVFYVKQFGVIVTDSAGNPIANKDIQFTINPTHYYKGFMSPSNGKSWVRYNTLSNKLGDTSEKCISEDFDRDGNLDAGEDTNRNGTLEPTNDAVVNGSGKTDENGKIIVKVTYPKSRALWSKQLLTAKTQVAGTEFVESTSFILPILADDVSDISVSAPNTFSPYGDSETCDTVNRSNSLPIIPTITNALTGLPASVIENDIVYKVNFTNVLGSTFSNQNYTINSSIADIKSDNNSNSFFVTDKNTEKDESGFNIELTVNGTKTLLFYKDGVAVDKTPPTITLNGPATLNLVVGSAYNEQGATVKDNIDATRPARPSEISGTVDTATAATYTVTYNATDATGNKATEVKRTVIVSPSPIR